MAMKFELPLLQQDHQSRGQTLADDRLIDQVSRQGLFDSHILQIHAWFWHWPCLGLPELYLLKTSIARSFIVKSLNLNSCSPIDALNLPRKFSLSADDDSNNCLKQCHLGDDASKSQVSQCLSFKTSSSACCCQSNSISLGTQTESWAICHGRSFTLSTCQHRNGSFAVSVSRIFSE